MSGRIQPFTDEQLRVSVNLRQTYEVWMDAERSSARLPYGMSWKTVSGRDYLYEVHDRQGNGRSVGPRSPETDAIYQDYRTTKADLRLRRDTSWEAVSQNGRLWRALRMPMLASEAAEILREADLAEMLGSQLILVGTNAVMAYSLEAGGRILGLADETRDFDMAWSAKEPTDDLRPALSMLKAVDATFTPNSERSSQARNSKAYEFELLAAPSTIGSMSKRDAPRPIPLPEQEWLLLGRPIDVVVGARDGTPARMVVPDPRWFALQKLWLSRQAKRDPQATQGRPARGSDPGGRQRGHAATLDGIRSEHSGRAEGRLGGVEETAPGMKRYGCEIEDSDSSKKLRRRPFI